MSQFSSIESLKNCPGQVEISINNEENSTVRRVLTDIESLMAMLTNDVEPLRSSFSSNLVNQAVHQDQITKSLYCPSQSSSITDVTINDEAHQVIEHLRQRVARLEYERHLLLASYQLLIKLLQ